MKLRKWTLALVLCLSLAACQSAPVERVEESPAQTEPSAAPAAEPASVPPAPADSVPSLAVDEEATVTLFRVVDGTEDGNLLLAKLCRCIGADVYRLPVGDIPVTLDGEAAEPSALEDGMVVEVSHNGVTLETYPAQFGQVYQIAGYSIGQEKNPGGTCYDLCGLYLQVLDDLWEKDPGLNDGIAMAGLDLSQAPGGLTESEKAALAWRFGEMHGVEVVQGTFDELKEQGYFTATAISTPAPEDGKDSPLWYQWEDGCLFSIKPNENHEGEMYSLPTLFFDAEKWRSPLGAYCFYDCSAGWPEMGTWSGYQIGSEMIS